MPTRNVFQRDVQTGGTSLYHPREAGGCPDVMNRGSHLAESEEG